MEKCPFGPFLVELRTQRVTIPQWKLAAKANLAAPNLRKMEKGESQPGVTVAMRIIQAMGLNIGETLKELALQEFGARPEGEENADILPALPDLPEAGCLFGIWLRIVRKHYGISQSSLAKHANYHARNMHEVENRQREPGVMTAIALVHPIPCNFSWFFNSLAAARIEVPPGIQSSGRQECALACGIHIPKCSGQ